MKRRNLASFIVVLISTFAVVIGCGNPAESVESGDTDTFKLYGNYSNTAGDNPQYVFDSGESHPYITFSGAPIVELDTGNHSVTITLDNVSILGGGNEYIIDSLKVEEFVGSEWIEFVEFDASSNVLTEIAVALVVDVSSSLGEQFSNVQAFSSNFATIIFENSDEAIVGCVSFATELNQLDLTNSQSEFNNFINALQPGEYTKMYDAMYAGIMMLQDSSLDVDGYALVTFTDGFDNYSDKTLANVIAALDDSNIKSYTMGLDGNGGIHESELEDLAVNGQYKIVDSIEDLEEAFSDFARAVSNVYSLTYERNDQVVAGNRLLRHTIYVHVE